MVKMRRPYRLRNLFKEEADEEQESYLQGMKAGTDDFITKPFDEEQLAARLSVAERILSLQTEVKQLQRLLPLCSYCKKIRDDQNYWEQVEEYIQDYKNKGKEMMGALVERRKDPKRRSTLIQSALKWAKTEFGQFIKDANAIFIKKRVVNE